MQPTRSQASAFARLPVWATSIAFWLVLGLVNAGSEVIDIVTGRQSAGFWEPVTWELTSSFAFALITPFLIEFALRVRFAPARAAVWAAHALALVAFSLLHVGGMVALRKIVYRLAGSQWILRIRRHAGEAKHGGKHEVWGRLRLSNCKTKRR